MKLIKVDAISVFFIVCIIFAQLFFANGIYLFICLTTLAVLFTLVQQVYKPGILAFILLYHILQVIAGVWLVNYIGKEIDDKTAETSTATILSVIGITALFIPLIYAQKKLPNVTFDDLRKSANEFSTDKVMRCYIIAFIGAIVLRGFAFLLPGITQVIFSLIDVRWMFFLLFGFVSILKKEKRNYFYLFVIIEFLSGFVSFFSEFKTVIFYVIILGLTLVSIINFQRVFYGSIIGIALAFFALSWGVIKTDYRDFLNGGEKSQSVVVTRDEALNKIYQLSSKIDQNSLEASAEDLLTRIQYTFHFAKTLQRVPAIIPFQNGQNWLDNLEFTTTPRFLNPDKPTIDNSVKATKYTGINYLTAKSGVSFSLGYFAECYIDFDKYGMMVLLLMIGTLYGIVYNYLMRKSSNNIIFNYSVVCAFFFEFYSFEMDGTYLLGRFFSNFVTFVLLINLFFPAIIDYISINPVKRNAGNKITLFN